MREKEIIDISSDGYIDIYIDSYDDSHFTVMKLRFIQIKIIYLRSLISLHYTISL